MIRITVMRTARYDDLSEKYENPIEHACDMRVGDTFYSAGGGDFYGGWMGDPHSAMISCNDGFRPVSFYIEAV